MKMLLILAAAGTLAACAGRGEDEVGAAPDRGDTTTVTTGADTAAFDTTGVVTPQPGETAETPDTSAIGADSAVTPEYPAPPSTDTTGALPDTSTFGGDTTGAAPADPGMTPDTSGMAPDTGMGQEPGAVDTTLAPTLPSDTAGQQ
ncbi:MAG: hypothetical protein ACREMX_05470 [Gemmatimonadales bacterium]